MITVLRMSAAAVFAFGATTALAQIDTDEVDLPEARFADTFTIQRFLDTDLAGGSFTAELARAYQERAAYEASYGQKGDGNWYDATAFAAKGEEAANGGLPQPWEPTFFGLTDPKFTIAYNATLKRIAKYSSERPAECAQLQALYDHWIEQSREIPHSITEPNAVFGGWVDAYKACQVDFVLTGFPVDACTPRLASRQAAAAYAADIGEDEANGVLDLIAAIVKVEGHTSTTASEAYNVRLGDCRAHWMRSVLVANGVRDARIEAISLGESEPAIDAGDNKEIFENRRVVNREE